jgi:hypothetical protein
LDGIEPNRPDYVFVYMGHRATGWAVAVGLAGSLMMHQPAASQTGISGRVEVKQVEAGFRLGGDSLRVRVYLLSGQALEYGTRDPDEIERILRLIAVFSAPGRSRLFAELEGNTLRSLQVSVP